MRPGIGEDVEPLASSDAMSNSPWITVPGNARSVHRLHFKAAGIRRRLIFLIL